MDRFQRIRERYEGGGRQIMRGFVRRALARSPITPNMVTVTGTALNAVAGALAYKHMFLAAAIVFVVGSLMDAVDGALAKVTNRISRFGAFLDSTLDRVSEGFMLTGLGLYFAEDGELLGTLACFISIAGSYLVSYTRARAESIGVECKVGMASRVERVVLVTAGLIVQLFVPGALLVVVCILAATASITVLQRVVHVRGQLIRADRESTELDTPSADNA